MARARLSPEERELRRKQRIAHSFSDAAYKHYDPHKEGYGSASEWIAAAEAMASGKGGFLRQEGKKSDSRRDKDLRELGLVEMPGSLAALKKAFRNAMFIAHPDYGGSNEAARSTIEAYQRLLIFFD